MCSFHIKLESSITTAKNYCICKATLDCATAFSSTDFRPDLAAFTIPTLIIHGTADKTVPIKPAGEAAAKAIPNATFIKYDDAPHGLFATHKHHLISDPLNFVKQV